MTSSDDFYRRERQRQGQRGPVLVNVSTQPTEQDETAASASLRVPPRRASMHVPHAAVQERRPSMPQRSFTGGLLTSSLPDSPTLPSENPTAPVPVAESPIPSNMAKRTERAIDPRKRPDRKSPSVHPTASFLTKVASPLTSESPKKVERTTTLSRVASAGSSPVPSDDVEMADVSEPSPSDHLARALVVFVEDAVAAGLRKFQKSTTREELDQATEENQKAHEAFEKYPQLLEQTEAKKKSAEQHYKSISMKLLQLSQSRDSKARVLADVICSQLAQISTVVSKASDQESSASCTELKPWTNRLKKLEENVHGQSSDDASYGALQSLETRLRDLESNIRPEQKETLQGEIQKLREEDQSTSRLLQNGVSDLSGRIMAMFTELNEVQDENRKATKLLDDDVRYLLRYATDNKSDVGNLRRDYRDLMKLTKDDICVLFNRDGNTAAEMVKLRQEDSDLWTAIDVLRDQSATQPDVDVIKRELNIYRDDRVSKSEFERMRQILEDLQHTGPRNPSTSTQLHDANIPNEVIGKTDSASTQNTSEMLTHSELVEALARVGQLEAEVSALNKKVTTDSISQSTTLFDYVKRYQQDMGELNASMAEVESKLSVQQVAIALMQENMEKLSSREKSSSNTPQCDTSFDKAEAELKTTTASHTLKIEQLQMQLKHTAELLHKIQNVPQGGVSPTWTEATNLVIQELQQMVGPLAIEVGNVQKLAASSEHSIRALTSRYNNLSSEQFSKRMANHLNAYPATLHVDQNALKLRLDTLQAQHNELNKTIDSIKDTVSEDKGNTSGVDLSRQDFEQRLKTQYYDVLEEKTLHARQEIGQSIDEVRSDQKASKVDLEAIQGRLDELERIILLDSFQRPAHQKPSPPTGMSNRGRSERPESQATSYRPLDDRIGYPDVQSGGSKRWPHDETEESTTVASVSRPSSPRKRVKWTE